MKAGDTIMTIDPRLAQAQLDQAQAHARARPRPANQRLPRRQPLQAAGAKRIRLAPAIRHLDHDRAGDSASVKADEAAVESAQVTLSYFTIKSPIDGRIGYVTQKIGNDVKANDVPLATINQIKPIYVSFPLPQADLPAVRQAMANGPVTVKALPVGDSGQAARRPSDLFRQQHRRVDRHDPHARHVRQSAREPVARPVLQRDRRVGRCRPTR